MNQKGFANIALIILVVVMAGALGYVTLVKKSNTKPIMPNQPQTQNTEQPSQQQKISIPEEYVKVTQSTANQATFIFSIPIKKQDLIDANIRHCVIGVSAGAAADGRQPECKDTTSSNSFSLQYNETTHTLVITDPSPGEWGVDSGPFRIGCAACVSAVEFNNIHTSDGQLLPNRMVTVY